MNKVKATRPPPPASNLRRMRDYVASVDPLSGPNVMRYAEQVFKDNGDGTMTMRRLPSYVRKSGD